MAHGKWNIDGKALSPVYPHLPKGPGPGVVGVLMGGKVENGRVFLKGMLGAVTVMQIPVHDEDTVHIEVFLGISGTDGHIVEEAKAHGARAFRVVPRGPDQGKGIVQFSSAHQGNGLAEPPGSQ